MGPEDSCWHAWKVICLSLQLFQVREMNSNFNPENGNRCLPSNSAFPSSFLSVNCFLPSYCASPPISSQLIASFLPTVHCTLYSASPSSFLSVNFFLPFHSASSSSFLSVNRFLPSFLQCFSLLFPLNKLLPSFLQCFSLLFPLS